MPRSVGRPVVETTDGSTFFSGADVRLYMSGPGLSDSWLDNVQSIAWNYQSPVMPHYNFDEMDFNNVSYGSRVVQGQLGVIRDSQFVDPLTDFVNKKSAGQAVSTSSQKLRTASSPKIRTRVKADMPGIPRGPFQLRLIFAPEEARAMADDPQVDRSVQDWGESTYGSILIEDVYFTSDSPVFANQTADVLVANYTFMAKGVVRNSPNGKVQQANV